MNKMLCIGDLHFQGSNTIFFNLFITNLEKIIKKGKYDHVILLGDIRHKFKQDDRATLTLVCDLFTMITKYSQLIVLVGNHDMDDSLQFLTDNHLLLPFKKWDKVTIVDRPIKKDLAVFCPYVPKGRLHEALDHIENWKKASIVFVHQEMQGVKMGATVSIDGDHWSEDYPLIISGHIHSKQKIGENIIYPGMPYDVGFDESEKRFVLEIKVVDGEISFKYIKTNMPRKIIVKLTYEEAKEWDIPEGEDYFKLKVCCTKQEFIDLTKTRKDLKNKNIKIIHICSDEKRVEKFLEERKKIGGSGGYKEQFKNLVGKEKENVRELYKKILTV